MKTSIIVRALCDASSLNSDKTAINFIAYSIASKIKNPLKFLNDCKVAAPKGMLFMLDSARGNYIPENFINGFEGWQGITEWQREQLSDKDNEFYFDAWNDVLDSATYLRDGFIYTLFQDGDLWAICYDLMTDEEKYNFGFDD